MDEAVTGEQLQALATALHRPDGTVPLSDLRPVATVFGPMLVDHVGALLRTLAAHG